MEIYSWIVVLTISLIQALIYEYLIDTKIFDHSLYYQRIQLVTPLLHILILSVILIGFTNSFPISNALVYVLEGGILIGFVSLPVRIKKYLSSEPILRKEDRSETEQQNNSENDSDTDPNLKNNLLREAIRYRHR